MAKNITLTKRLTEKGGITSYARPGVRASVYFAKGMFVDGIPPDTVTLVADPHFVAPGAVATKAPAKAAPKPVKKAAGKKAKAKPAPQPAEPATEIEPDAEPVIA